MLPQRCRIEDTLRLISIVCAESATWVTGHATTSTYTSVHQDTVAMCLAVLPLSSQLMTRR